MNWSREALPSGRYPGPEMKSSPALPGLKTLFRLGQQRLGIDVEPEPGAVGGA